METLEPILSEHPFFQGLEERYFQLLLGCASNVRFEAGKFIFREGDEANQFYLIRHGRVSLEIHAPERGPITVDTLEEGEILGWSWLFPPIAIALTREPQGWCARSLWRESACAKNRSTITTWATSS